MLSDERIARAVLGRLVEPGVATLGRALREHGPCATVRLLREGKLGGARGERRDVPLPDTDGRAQLQAGERLGARFICPGDGEWPTQLDDLGDERPYGLWLRGNADLRYCCLRSVSVVGARAATAYGAHVATDLAATLAQRGWVPISGGAFGIDGAAHRGALACEGPTVVVLASGLDVPYPRGHAGLFDQVVRSGVLVSEWPPGTTPTRYRFLVRNRVIAALSRGTLVVEAASRSGALSTARRASELNRNVMAVPGPVTSRMSEGCHMLLREYGAVCVTRASEVIEQVGAMGVDMASPRKGAVTARDLLDSTASRVLEALPATGGTGPAEICVNAGVDVDTVLRCLGQLASAGFASRSETGWRAGS